MTVWCDIFLLNKDILQWRCELGRIQEKNTFFMPQLRNCIPKYLSIVQFVMFVPNYVAKAQFLPNSSLTFTTSQKIIFRVRRHFTIRGIRRPDCPEVGKG